MEEKRGTKLYAKISPYINDNNLNLMTILLIERIRKGLTLIEALVQLNEERGYPKELTVDIAEILKSENSTERLAGFENAIGKKPFDTRQPGTKAVKVWLHMMNCLKGKNQQDIIDGLWIFISSDKYYWDDGTPYQEAKRVLANFKL